MTLPQLVPLALQPGPGLAAPVPPPMRAPRQEDAAPGTLTVRTLGALQISREAAPLAWPSAKPRELLVFLLCHPGGRTREQVGLAFWPEASAEQVRNNFHVTLHRLRKSLGGAHWVTVARDQYKVDSRVTVDFDATRFELDVTAGLARLRKGPESSKGPQPLTPSPEPGEGERLLEAALALYGGDFLEHEVVGDWHLELRDRLRHKYIAGLAALGELRMKQERWAEAAEAWRRLVARDELDERAYRALMTCHARLGERSQVQQLYQRLVRVLKRELEAEPEGVTMQLYRRLVSS